MTAGGILITEIPFPTTLNTSHFYARAVRHAAQINARAHSSLSQCLVHEQALNQPVFHASCSIVHFLTPHVNWPLWWR